MSWVILRRQLWKTITQFGRESRKKLLLLLGLEAATNDKFSTSGWGVAGSCLAFNYLWYQRRQLASDDYKL